MFLFVSILLIEILSGAELDLFIPSFPELQKLFDLSPAMVQLTLSINFIPFCICSLFAGALGDRYNKRWVILGSLLLFILGSCLCVFAVHYEMLLAGRFLQGIGIAAPAVLSYVVLTDEYPAERQPSLLGTLNAVATLAMAFAPVIGSYINLYFKWRANFTLLLGMGAICFILGYFAIPSKKGDPRVSLSPKTYWPLLISNKVMTFVVVVCLLILPYWFFVGMAPILYMEDFGVPLEQFGYYQGSIAAVFSIMNLLSAAVLKSFGQKSTFYVSLGCCGLSGVLALCLAFVGTKSPLFVTFMMLLYAGAIVVPINLIYIASLEAMENAKSRIAALIQSIRLVMTAALLELVSYFYHGQFFLIGMTMFLITVGALIFIGVLYRKNWLRINAT